MNYEEKDYLLAEKKDKDHIAILPHFFFFYCECPSAFSYQ